jgi:F-type H+-transporting ATPase subunit gamma
MAVNTKAIKSRIKSVKSTKKITKAMELVSASKMRKAVQAALDTRLYATLSAELLGRLSNIQEPDYPLLQRRDVKNVLMVLVTSNRGLCGSFNANVLKKSKTMIEDAIDLATLRHGGDKTVPTDSENIKIHVLGIGKKSVSFAKRNNLDLVAVFDQLNEKPTVNEIVPIANVITDGFIEEKFDKAVVVYTDFKSSLSQEVKVRQLLPISDVDLQKTIDEAGDSKERVKLSEDSIPIECYFLEPERDAILEYVIPRLVEVQLYGAILESAASEHSARMMAMKSASDAAGDMIDELTLTFNKARQAAITQEIAEIAGGAAALG